MIRDRDEHTQTGKSFIHLDWNTQEAPPKLGDSQLVRALALCICAMWL